MVAREISTLDILGRELLRARPGHGCELLAAGAVALRVREFWPAARAAEAAAAVRAHRARWVEDFGGLQYCLGRAWYTHLETGRDQEYFARAAEADADVEAAISGLQSELRDAVARITGAAAVQRRGWCGAGVHVFPAGNVCARTGGDLHFDDEGLSRAQLRTRGPALSLVLMLQPPESGGALRLWQATYEDGPGATPAQRSTPFVDVLSAPGDLVVFDSLRLHQIQPFGGVLDRISATLHAAKRGADWETWF